jgi:putative transcriptional regulator
MAKKKKVSSLAKALLETAGDMRNAGLMNKAAHEKITLRHSRATGALKASPTGPQIRAKPRKPRLKPLEPESR